jgi:hypothetical protein
MREAPFFRGLNDDQVAMIESSLRVVPLIENTLLVERGKRKKTEYGGEGQNLGILPHRPASPLTLLFSL